MAKYRCPVDDKIFDSRTTDRVPTLQGHPDCDGPECRAKFGGGKLVVSEENKIAEIDQRSTGGSQLDPAPSGQGW